MEEDVLQLLDEKEKKTIDNMGENISHEENIQHDNRTCKNHTDITIKTKNEKKKATPPTSWEKYGNLFSSDDEEEKQDDIEIITEKQGIPRKMATDNSKPKPGENTTTKRLNEKKMGQNPHKPIDGNKCTEEEKKTPNMTSYMLLQIRIENLEAEIRELKGKLDEKKIASEILIFKIHEAETLEDVEKLKKKFPSKFFMSYT